MQKTTTAITAISLALGITAVSLHQKNNTLGRDISAATEQCALRIGALQAQYQEEIDDLRNYMLEQYNHNPESINRKPQKPRFTQLLSHEHRIQAVSNKYDSLLISALLDKNGINHLRQLLFQRERQADAVKSAADAAAAQTLQSELDTTETQIRALLTHPMDYDQYKIQRQRDL